MANVKYVIREFVPTPRQTGTHSFFAQSQPDNVITNIVKASDDKSYIFNEENNISQQYGGNQNDFGRGG